MKMEYEHIPLRADTVSVNGYLIWDADSGEAAMVDPGGEAELILARIARRALRLRYIILTHGHFDHISAAARLKEETGAEVCMDRRDEPFIRDSGLNASDFAKSPPVRAFGVDRYISEADCIPLGDGCLRVLATPGHTPGELSVYFRGHLFCGDTVLRGTTGRMDLAGADADMAADSIREKIFSLPDDTVVHCGHGEPTTVGYEKEYNDTVGSRRRSER